jgi:tRNA1(Val) A37 N6-methylase TrmN6
MDQSQQPKTRVYHASLATETNPPYHNSHSFKNSLRMRHEESICEMDPHETWIQEVSEG